MIASLISLAGAKKWNILSLDSAMYEGFMTASFVDYMEQNAYDQAHRSYCIPERKSGRVAMPEIFDTIAGSETGAIIASALVIPN